MHLSGANGKFEFLLHRTLCLKKDGGGDRPRELQVRYQRTPSRRKDGGTLCEWSQPLEPRQQKWNKSQRKCDLDLSLRRTTQKHIRAQSTDRRAQSGLRKLYVISCADPKELKSVEDALLPQFGIRSKSAEPAGVPRFMMEWQVKPSAKRDDKNEEVPFPPKSKGRAPNFMKEWQSKASAELESIPQVQPPTKSRAKSEGRRQCLCS